MSRFKVLFFVIFVTNRQIINAEISDKRMCVDEECTVPISYAKTLLRYASPEPGVLSFVPNADVTIYSKSAGSREDLWGVVINGKRGYVPKHMLRETKVLQKPTLLVNTEANNATEKVPLIEPDKVKEPFEVIDGTTIYLTPEKNEPSENEAQKDESVVKNILSTLSDWVQDDNDSEDDDEDDDEEDLDEEVEDEESEEEEPKLEVQQLSGELNSELKAKVEDLINTSNETPNSAPNLSTTNEINEQLADTPTIETKEPLIETSPVTNEVKVDPLPTIQKIQSEDIPPLPSIEINQSSEPINAQPDKQLLDSDKILTLPSAIETKEESINTAAGSLKTKEELVEDPSSIATAEALKTNENLINNAVSGNDLYVIPQATELKTTAVPIETKEDSVFSLNPTNGTSEHQPEDATQFKEQLTNPVTLESEEKKIEIETVAKQNIEDFIPMATPEASKTTEDLVHPSGNQSEDIPQPTEEQLTEPLATSAPESEEKKTEATTTLPEYEIPPQPIDEDVNVTPNPVPGIPETPILSALDFLGKASAQKIGDEIKDPGVDAPVFNEVIGPTSSEEKTEESNSSQEVTDHSTNELNDGTQGFFSGLFSIFEGGSKGSEEIVSEDVPKIDETGENEQSVEASIAKPYVDDSCDPTSCQKFAADNETTGGLLSFNPDILLYLVTTAISVIIFLFGYIAFDKNKREGPLIARINQLEKNVSILVKENQILQESGGHQPIIDTELVDNLKQELSDLVKTKSGLEEQIQSLEKELENSTEVGMELNRMLSEILSSESGSDVLRANVEHLQRQLVELQGTVNSLNENLTIVNTENHELKLELELSVKKVHDLQSELDKMVTNVLSIEEEKELQQASLENEVKTFKQKYEETFNKLRIKEDESSRELAKLQSQLSQAERDLQLKLNEITGLKDAIKQVKGLKKDTIEKLLDANSTKAELQLLRTENQNFIDKLRQEHEDKVVFEKSLKGSLEEVNKLREKYEETDKLKTEALTKLDVLSNYFKEREAELQREISKHEAIWAEKRGEATSTNERIKFLQEQIQNYKAQNESLKQEIVSQEVELKSQISVLEKKGHENWVSARQAERKLEDAKQEAAQLRHRLTLRERSILEEKGNRLQSPIENAEISLGSSASPPLLYSRDHITKSPPIPGLPHFLPPPPGVPFMPPPPFIPPPSMFPGDHRPPPLGRMSSPPINSRYSPSSRGYSPYDSSPSDSEYGTSPPQRRGFSPYHDRRDYKRPPPPKTNGRNMKGASSGSANSNESLEKISRHQSKV